MITQYLIQKSEGLLKQEPEALNYGNSYTMFNTGSVECEVGEFLYAMVRVLKPEHILETGTYKGISAAYMAQGLFDNKFGEITTIEYNRDFIEEAKSLWVKLGLSNFITPIQGLSYSFDPKNTVYDLLLLDSEPEIRFREFERFYPFLKEGGYAFIHDLGRDMSQNTHNKEHPEVDPWPFGSFPKSLRDHILDRELMPFTFPTPRGLWGFYKSRSDDYAIQ